MRGRAWHADCEMMVGRGGVCVAKSWFRVEVVITSMLLRWVLWCFDLVLTGRVVYTALHPYTVRSRLVASDAVYTHTHVRASQVAGAESAQNAA